MQNTKTLEPKSAPSRVLAVEQVKKVHDGLLQVNVACNPYIGEKVTLEFLMPPPPLSKSIPIDKIEEEGLKWTEEKGLAQGQILKKLKGTFLGGLMAFFYAAVDVDKLPFLDRWFKLIFLYDDWIDESHTSKVDSQCVKHIIDRQMEIIYALDKGCSIRNVLTDDDDSMAKAWAEVFVEFQVICKEKGVSTKEFIDSLERYLQGTIIEKVYEENCWKPHDDTFSSFREDTAGVNHVIIAGANVMGINTEALIKRYYNLRLMNLCAVKCVAFSNDIYSHTKELKASVEKTKNDPNPNQNLVDAPLMNLVQVEWQHLPPMEPEEGLKEAFRKSIKKHNELMEDYYLHKKLLMQEMEKEYLAARDNINNGLKNFLPSLSTLDKIKKDIEIYCEIMEGFLAHPWWGIVTPRYNLGMNRTGEAFVQSLKQYYELNH